MSCSHDPDRSASADSARRSPQNRRALRRTLRETFRQTLAKAWTAAFEDGAERTSERSGGGRAFSSWRKIVGWTCCCLALWSGATGCHRSHYRREADAEAFALIDEKAQHPHWELDDFEIYVDPRSRMFDPFDPDVPPLPPDDPASHEYMHEVYGMKGYPGWHYSGETSDVENPVWRDYLPVDDDGVLRLDSRRVTELARLHSRSYQAELEELYLSALDVSFERFRFDSQLFAGYQLFSSWDGRDRRGGGGESRSLFTASTFSESRNSNAWTIQRSFATGGDLVVGFANSLVWQFAGPDDYAGATLLDFSLVQPLLRGAGRDRILERLTLAERTLLANVRAMERYRGAFYVDLMTGRSPQGTDGPSRRGGVLGGSGLEGFSGLGAGGFGRLATTGGGGVGGGATGAGAGQAGGFIGLLQQQQQIRNQEDNIARLRTNLYRLETGLRELLTTIPARQEQIPQQRLQVAQSRQALVLAESRLINSRNAFEAQLDNYKSTLGLPPEVCIEVEDSMLDRFQLISKSLQERQKEIDAVIEGVGNTNDKILAGAKEDRDEATNIVRRSLAWSDELDAAVVRLGEGMRPVDAIQKKLSAESIAEVQADLEKLREAIPDRVAAVDRLRRKYEEQQNSLCPLLPVPTIDPVIFDVEKLKAVDAELGKELDRLREKFAAYQARYDGFAEGLETLRKDGPTLEDHPRFDQVRDRAVLGSQNLLTDLRLDVLALELLQARIRTFTVDLVPIDIETPVAMQIASQYRHDLMNARASLVDSWRLIEFNADNLESTLDVVFSGDLSNVGQNPFDLKSTTGRMRAGLQFDAPIVRLSERNTYRQSLIEYQQARRNFYNSLDSVSRGLRSIVRTIETNQFNFEIQRYAVIAAVEQIDLNEDIRVLNEALRQPTGVTAARDSVSALTDLLNAQNDFLSIWINYELQRMWLDLDLGTMQIDDDGRWIDPGPIGAEFLRRVAERDGFESNVSFEAAAEAAEPVAPGKPLPGPLADPPGVAPRVERAPRSKSQAAKPAERAPEKPTVEPAPSADSAPAPKPKTKPEAESTEPTEPREPAEPAAPPAKPETDAGEPQLEAPQPAPTRGERETDATPPKAAPTEPPADEARPDTTTPGEPALIPPQASQGGRRLSGTPTGASTRQPTPARPVSGVDFKPVPPGVLIEDLEHVSSWEKPSAPSGQPQPVLVKPAAAMIPGPPSRSIRSTRPVVPNPTSSPPPPRLMPRQAMRRIGDSTATNTTSRQ